MYLIFDTETTGLPKNHKAPITDTDNWPRCVQIAWQLHDEMGNLLEHQDFLIRPDGYNIPYKSQKIHGISTRLAQEKGKALEEVLSLFNQAIDKSRFIVGHNVRFDLNIVGSEFYRMGMETRLFDKPVLDTCTENTASLCQLPGGRGGRFKLPTLTELYTHLFKENFKEAHNATADVDATTRCFLELIRQEAFSTKELDKTPDYFKRFKEHNPQIIALSGIKHINLKEASKRLADSTEKPREEAGTSVDIKVLEDAPFVHLHNHSQFSVLESTTAIEDLIQATIAMHMPAVALTDLGNMMGAFNFVESILKYNKSLEAENDENDEGELPEKSIKPIVGSEFNVCENHKDRTHKDNGYRIVLLAKNKNGYRNLTKLSSISHTEGQYYVPRIDKELLLQYKEDIMVLSGNLHGEIPHKILNIGEKQAEESLLWWKEHFGDDFYLEVMRHGLEEEEHVNDVLRKFSGKHGVKVVATNDTYYIHQEDAEAQDILVCVKEGESQSTPKGRGRGFRRGLPNDTYYFKSPEEMKQLFADWPEAIINIQEIIDKVSIYDLARDILLPKFQIPDAFKDPEDEKDGGLRGESAYLRHLTYEGAKKRWGTLTDAYRERLDFELETIIDSKYPGYFLIVWDLIKAARKMGVSVGPGRGSAAGSAVAYCLWITNIDPIKYDLLFERFLSLDRISMPDIDIDFDDDGRQKVIEYVTNKYGQKNVAQIITYGTLGAKSSIRDTGRVMELPLHETDRIAKLLPPVKLKTIFNETEKNKQKIQKLRKEEQLKINELKNIADGEDLEAITIQQAQKIEGSVRNTGVHACGFIITPEEITNLVPIATAKDSEMHVTQFDNSVVESAGLLKMDFLGLKTLSLIKDTVKIVKATQNIVLEPDEFPLDDAATYALFQKGETIGVFQFESAGMRKSLKELKPTVFADLIAMVALYRPGPMDYIPLYVDRKHGRSKIVYDLPEMEEILKETYGVTVYQEQVMRLSQIIAGFTRAEADKLRKAMGKKLIEDLEVLKPKFMKNGQENGHPLDVLEKIWKDWEKFASYAFNKSHATCYAFIAYQTAYLKANYPAAFMAATLSNNMNDIKKVTFYMDECKHSGIPVLGPDVNESYYKFAVNKQNHIRFGMGGIKGVGQGAVESIIKERKKNGKFTSIFDFAKRNDLRAVNKRVFEGLALAGGFDTFKGTHRAQYFAPDEKGKIFIDKAIRFGNRYQEDANSSQMSLFGDSNAQTALPEPEIPETEPWTIMQKLSKEKEVVGIYISGHPLDDFKNELRFFCNSNLSTLQNPNDLIDRELSVGGIVTAVIHRVSKNGKGWALFTLEDYNDSYEFRIFNEEYLRFKHFLIPNTFLHIRLKITKGWKEGETRTRFQAVTLLQDVLENQAKKVILQFSIRDITDDLINQLQTLVKTYKGKKELIVVIYSEEEKIELHMQSRKFKIQITNELLKEFNDKKWHFSLR